MKLEKIREKIVAVLSASMDKIEEILETVKKPKRENKFIIVSVFILLISFTGILIYDYINLDKSVIKVCESSIDYNKGIGLTFYVSSDGKTIEKIEKNDTVTLEFIEKNMNTGENTEKILEEYKKNLKFIYDATLEKYKDVEWFSASLVEDEGMVKTKYIFDVSNPDFDYDKYKDLISEFALEYYYDMEKHMFIYDEDEFLSGNTPLGTISEVGCHTAEVIQK